VTRLGTYPPSIFKKIHYLGIYPLRLSIFCTKLTLFSLCLGLSGLDFRCYSFLFSSSSSTCSSALRTRLTFFIFKAYQLSANYTPALIFLQSRGSLSLFFSLFTFLNVYYYQPKWQNLKSRNARTTMFLFQPLLQRNRYDPFPS
jgi:hypothetical protein